MTGSLQKKLLEAMGFVYDSEDVSQICTTTVRDKVLEAVRDIALSVQQDIDKAKGHIEYAKTGYWRGYRKAKEEDKKLLVGSSSEKNPKKGSELLGGKIELETGKEGSSTKEGSQK